MEVEGEMLQNEENQDGENSQEDTGKNMGEDAGEETGKDADESVVAATEPESPEKPEPVQEEMVPRENYLRAMADLDNLRRRGAIQTRTALQNDRKNLLSRFLEVLDSLQMALWAHEGETNEWIEGTRGMYRQMVKIFGDYNIEPIEAKDQPFDPNLHEAMSQVKMPDLPAGTVVEEVQRGYRFADGTLLRAARVIVSTKE